MSSSARIGLPFIAVNQAQKEITHNEALVLLDLLTQAAVEDRDLTAPPVDPVDGGVWIVASPATGDWAGHDGALAQRLDGGWRFVAPFEGLRAWLRDEALEARFDGTAWQVGQQRAARLVVGGIPVVGGQQPAIADPAGGTTVDTEARTALSAVLAALRAHGLIAL